MKEKFLLESPVFTVEAALTASKAGVNRLELCSNYAEGGETPGAGMLSFLKQRLSIPIFVMIRPRGGDFVYSADEINVMKEEIRLLKKLGADGFVFGVLNSDRTLNEESCRELIQSAEGLPCTLHRAIDVSRDLFDTLESAIECGFKRVLTSGGADSVQKGMDRIFQMLTLAKDRIIVMPGGGLKPEHVAPLSESGFLKEIHASCKSVRLEGYNEKEFSGGPKLHSDIPDGVLTVNPDLVAKFKNVIIK